MEGKDDPMRQIATPGRNQMYRTGPGAVLTCINGRIESTPAMTCSARVAVKN